MLVWEAHKSKVRCLAFRPGGQQLASSAEAVTSVRLWEPSTGRKVGELRGRWGVTSGVEYSPDGKLIATVTAHSRVVIWDAETNRAMSVLAEHGKRYGPAFSPDGACVAATGWNGVALWESPATPLPESLGPYSHDVREPDVQLAPEDSKAVGYSSDSLAFSPDGKLVAANGHDAAVLWNRNTKNVERVIPHSGAGALTVVKFSPNSERLAVGFAKAVEIYALAGGERPLKLVGHTLFVRAVGFMPDGRIMTAGSDGTVRFWDATTGALTRTFDWRIGRVYSAAFSPDGLTCAAGGENGQIVVWDVDA